MPPKKLSKRSAQGHDLGKDGHLRGSSLLAIIFLLFISVSIISILLSLSGFLNVLTGSSNIPPVSLFSILESVFGVSFAISTSAASIEYQELIQRAQRLAEKYKNITQLHPTLVEHTNALKELESLATRSKENKVTLSSVAGLDSSAPKLGGLAAPHTRSKATLSTNIIIGIAQDIDPKNFAVFCGSIREVVKDSPTDVVVFVNSPTNKRIKEIGARFNINLKEFDFQKDIEANFRKYHPSTIRWKLLQQFFGDVSLRNQYLRVLMIDVRDSYFQADPFVVLAPSSIAKQSYFYAFQGVEDKTIFNCGWNGGWIKDCFGQSTLDRVGANTIICSGVSIGSMDVVYGYLKLMSDIVSGYSEAATYTGLNPQFPMCERNGVDQGVHNVLVHTDMIPHITIFTQSNGRVANMQARVARVTSSNIVVNGQGQEVAIVHQYDRFPELQRHVFSKYVYWMDSSDFTAVWKDEPMCKNYKYQIDVDKLKGRCDLKMRGGASSAATCCDACSNVRGCEAFTFYNGACFLKSCGGNGKGAGAGEHLTGAISGYLV